MKWEEISKDIKILKFNFRTIWFMLNFLPFENSRVFFIFLNWSNKRQWNEKKSLKTLINSVNSSKNF